MNSKAEYVMSVDTNAIANGIIRDINDIDRMERMLSCMRLLKAREKNRQKSSQIML